MGRVLETNAPSLKPPSAPTRVCDRTLRRLRAALKTAAELVEADVIYLPIFERLEREIAIEEARAGDLDPIERARAIARAVRH